MMSSLNRQYLRMPWFIIVAGSMAASYALHSNAASTTSPEWVRPIPEPLQTWKSLWGNCGDVTYCDCNRNYRTSVYIDFILLPTMFLLSLMRSSALPELKKLLHVQFNESVVGLSTD